MLAHVALGAALTRALLTQGLTGREWPRVDSEGGIQFNLLLSPYPCFISLLYLDLYVLGDDALIS